MDALLDWIDNLPGPQFLGLYASVIAATLAACFVSLRFSGGGGSSEAEPLPGDPDPYEIAYLRGGRRAVQSLALLDLAHRGYVRKKAATGGIYIRQVEGPPDPLKLSEPLREVFRAIGAGEQPWRKLLISSPAREAIDRLIKPHETKLGDRFVVLWTTRLQAYLLGAAVVIGLGGFKLVDALAEGRENIGFLIAMGVGALILLIVVTAGRLNAAGRRYLNRLRVGYGGDTELPLAFALSGPAALAGSANAAYASMLGVNPNAAGRGWSSDSCGTTCGSSCSGGDGCGGGGCGGCGD